MSYFNQLKNILCSTLHYLSNIAKPTLAVITNIGTAHIGNLGSRENILKAKLEILDGMNGGTIIKHGLRIPSCCANFNEFVNQMNKNEQKFISKL